MDAKSENNALHNQEQQWMRPTVPQPRSGPNAQVKFSFSSPKRNETNRNPKNSSEDKSETNEMCLDDTSNQRRNTINPDGENTPANKKSIENTYSTNSTNSTNRLTADTKEDLKRYTQVMEEILEENKYLRRQLEQREEKKGNIGKRNTKAVKRNTIAETLFDLAENEEEFPARRSSGQRNVVNAKPSIFAPTQDKRKRISIEREKKICLMIQNIKNPVAYKNPILLRRETEEEFPTAVRANILRYGDIKVWFKSEDEMIAALEKYNAKTIKKFGQETVANRWRKNDEKFVIRRVSAMMNKEDITTFWMKKGWGISIVKEIPYKKNKNWKTIFIQINDDATKAELYDKKKILIGYALYKLEKFKSKNTPQCYKCQRMGHVAKTCYAEDCCRFCAENHDSRKCSKKEEQKLCPKCKINHKNDDRICRAEILAKMKMNKNRNRFARLRVDEEAMEDEESPSPPGHIWGFGNRNKKKTQKTNRRKDNFYEVTEEFRKLNKIPPNRRPAETKKEEKGDETPRPRYQRTTMDLSMQDTIRQMIQEMISTTIKTEIRSMIGEILKETLQNELRGAIQQAVCSQF